MPDPLSLTVVIPTRDRSGMLRECLDALLGQDAPPSQIIVVDDGSTDSTPEMLGEYGERIEAMSGQGAGKSMAVNASLERVQGGLLWIFDDDDVALPDATARIRSAFEGQPTAGIAAASFEEVRSTPEGRIGESLQVTDPPPFEKSGLLPLLLEANCLTGASLVCRTDAMLSINGFDPRLIRSQDYDLAIRLARDYEAVRVPGGPTYFFRQHGGVRGTAQDPIAAQERRKTWLHYDRMIFTALHGDLDPEAYVHTDMEPPNRLRAGLFQRAFVMARRNLWPQVRVDLEAACALDQEEPLSEAARQSIRRMAVDRTYYGCGGLGDHPTAMRQVVSGLTGPVAKEVRREIAVALARSVASSLRAGKIGGRRRLQSATIALTAKA
jgi:glycosyltransferase involved in cell wall biosynthesis